MTSSWTALGLVSLLWAAILAIAFARRPAGRSIGQYLGSFVALEAATLGLFWLFHEPRPGEALVEKIERHIDVHPCAGPVGRRWREYRFANGGNGTADRRWVYFILRNRDEPGRRSVGVREGWADESGDRLVARGRYEIASDRLSVDYCGVTLGARYRL